MEHWKRTMQIGTRYFAEGAWVDAREQYLQALALAQVLFDRWPDPDAAVAALVVSQHNLADLHLQLQRPDAAIAHLRACHEHLLRAMSDERLSTGLRDAALRHSNHSYLRLLQVSTEHGRSASPVALTRGAPLSLPVQPTYH
jgi:tetratricopeptide (TPR) repeat protein